MSFLSHLHTELRQSLKTRAGATHAPDDVRTGLHKSYERMEQIQLPNPQKIQMSLADALNERISYRGGSIDEKISFDTWGTLLGLAVKKRGGSSKRNYPSGGALYPIETYVISGAVPDSPLAAFHYNPSLHTLEKLWNLSDTNVANLVMSKHRIAFSSVIILTSVWLRSSAKYGHLTYLHALLEAGHISENILLVATALNIKSRPMAGFNDDLIIELLDLDREKEQPVHTIILSCG